MWAGLFQGDGSGIDVAFVDQPPVEADQTTPATRRPYQLTIAVSGWQWTLLLQVHDDVLERGNVGSSVQLQLEVCTKLRSGLDLEQ